MPATQFDPDAVETYKETMRPDWTFEDDGLAQVIKDAEPAVSSTNTQGAVLGGIAYEALLACLNLPDRDLDVDLWDRDTMELVLAIAKATLDIERDSL